MSLDYAIRVSLRARRLQIKVSPFGEVEVVLPRGMSRRHIPAFVDQHQGWIQKTRARLIAIQPEAEEQGLPDKISLLAAGGQCWAVSYQLTPSLRSSMTESVGLLQLQVADEAAARQTLQRWLSRKARDYLAPCLQQLSEETGLSFQRISIRAQKTRWGSCSSTGTISLNRALMFLDTELIRYLMLHELCHTRQMNHSRAYWALVESFEPDYRRYEQALRAAATKVPLWAQLMK